MSQYRFVPNSLTKKAFNLVAHEYVGNGMTPVLQAALGKENYDKYMVAQDPLCGGKKSGEIRIILNPSEQNPELMRFESIGTVYRLN